MKMEQKKTRMKTKKVGKEKKKGRNVVGKRNRWKRIKENGYTENQKRVTCIILYTGVTRTISWEQLIPSRDYFFANVL